jgi:hypothetical protein
MVTGRPAAAVAARVAPNSARPPGAGHEAGPRRLWRGVSRAPERRGRGRQSAGHGARRPDVGLHARRDGARLLLGGHQSGAVRPRHRGAAGRVRRSVWRWAVQLAEALRYLHASGEVHRDIKGENVLLSGCDGRRVGQVRQPGRGRCRRGVRGRQAGRRAWLQPEGRALGRTGRTRRHAGRRTCLRAPGRGRVLTQRAGHGPRRRPRSPAVVRRLPHCRNAQPADARRRRVQLRPGAVPAVLRRPRGVVAGRRERRRRGGHHRRLEPPGHVSQWAPVDPAWPLADLARRCLSVWPEDRPAVLQLRDELLAAAPRCFADPADAFAAVVEQRNRWLLHDSRRTRAEYQPPFATHLRGLTHVPSAGKEESPTRRRGPSPPSSTSSSLRRTACCCCWATAV